MQLKLLAGAAVTIYTGLIAFIASMLQDIDLQGDSTLDYFLDYGLVIVFGYLALRQVVKWLEAARSSERKQFEARLEDHKNQIALLNQRVKDLERENSELLKKL